MSGNADQGGRKPHKAEQPLKCPKCNEGTVSVYFSKLTGPYRACSRGCGYREGVKSRGVDEVS